jgi:hypothetical protein
VSFERCGQEVDGVAVLLTAGFEEGQQGFREAAGGFALGAERGLTQNDRVA